MQQDGRVPHTLSTRTSKAAPAAGGKSLAENMCSWVHFEQQRAACCWVWRSSDLNGKAVNGESTWRRREDQEKWKWINTNHLRLLWWPELCLKVRENSRRFSHLKMSRDSLTFGNVRATQICTTDTQTHGGLFYWKPQILKPLCDHSNCFSVFCHQKQSVSRSCLRRNNESLSQTFYDHPFTIMHFIHIIQLFGKCYKSFSAFISAIIEVT